MQALDDDSGLARPVDLVADVARGPAAYALEVVEISGERAPLDVEEADGELSRPEVAAFREELKELTLVLGDAGETQSCFSLKILELLPIYLYPPLIFMWIAPIFSASS